MATRKSTADYSVKARMHQLESAVVTADHLSKHPDKFRRRHRIGERGVSREESSSDDDGSEDETFGLADFIKTLTLTDVGADSASGGMEALQEAFKILDCDNDGFITLGDLREAMRNDSDDEDDDEANEMTDEDLIEMIAAADKRGDGKIDFESFVRMLEPRKSKSGQAKRKEDSEKRKSKSTRSSKVK